MEIIGNVMKLDIQYLSEEFKKTICINNWLTNIGNDHDLDDRIFLPFNIQHVKRKEQAYKLMRSDEWTNIDIEVFNNMLAFLDFYSKNKNIINELAVEGKRIFDEYRNSLNSVLLRYKLKESVVDYILMPTLIRAFQEFYLSKVYKEMLIDFNRNLLKILNAGYLPCGWKYSFAQEDQSYNPLTYIEEYLEENLNGFEKSFNYSAGSLYLF